MGPTCGRRSSTVGLESLLQPWLRCPPCRATTFSPSLGRSTSSEILEKLKIDPNTKTDDLSETEINEIRTAIDNHYRVEGELRTQVGMNIKRLMDLGCYRGLRHRKSLPVHGQRTSTNARTRKGPKRAAVKKKGATRK